MATDPNAETRLKSGAVPTTNQSLKPYRGVLVPGIYFSSGYCLLAFDFPSVPPEDDPYSYVRMITPDGEQTFYVDPEAVGDVLKERHTYDEMIGSQITRDQLGAKAIRIMVDGDDGTRLDLELSVGQSMTTRALNAMAALTPKAIARTHLGTTVVSVLLSRLLDSNGTKIAGRTEKDSPYRVEADRVHVITDATATLDGADLGTPTLPAEQIDFGDAKLGDIPLFIQGTAYLPVPEQEAVANTER